MASTVSNRPSQYRARAQQAREKAQSEADEAARKALLNDAELWERMADYEARNPTFDFGSPAPRENAGINSEGGPPTSRDRSRS